MWLQADGLEALDRALLLQTHVELDSFVEDLQSFVFPAPHSRAPSNHKCASSHCTTPFLYPHWGNTTTITVDYSTLNDSPSKMNVKPCKRVLRLSDPRYVERTHAQAKTEKQGESPIARRWYLPSHSCISLPSSLC